MREGDKEVEVALAAAPGAELEGRQAAVEARDKLHQDAVIDKFNEIVLIRKTARNFERVKDLYVNRRERFLREAPFLIPHDLMNQYVGDMSALLVPVAYELYQANLLRFKELDHKSQIYIDYLGVKKELAKDILDYYDRLHEVIPSSVCQKTGKVLREGPGLSTWWRDQVAGLTDDSLREIWKSNIEHTEALINGAEVFHLAKSLIGDPAVFRQGMELCYSRKIKGQPFTTDDFIQAMQDASGKDFVMGLPVTDTENNPVVTVTGTPIDAVADRPSKGDTTALDLSQIKFGYGGKDILLDFPEYKPKGGKRKRPQIHPEDIRRCPRHNPTLFEERAGDSSDAPGGSCSSSEGASAAGAPGGSCSSSEGASAADAPGGSCSSSEGASAAGAPGGSCSSSEGASAADAPGGSCSSSEGASAAGAPGGSCSSSEGASAADAPGGSCSSSEGASAAGDSPSVACSAEGQVRILL